MIPVACSGLIMRFHDIRCHIEWSYLQKILMPEAQHSKSAWVWSKSDLYEDAQDVYDLRFLHTRTYNSFTVHLSLELPRCVVPRPWCLWLQAIWFYLLPVQWRWEHLITGCIPVIVMDGVLQPFENMLNYSKFSVRIQGVIFADLMITRIKRLLDMC